MCEVAATHAQLLPADSHDCERSRRFQPAFSRLRGYREGMDYTTTKLPRVGSKAYQQEKAAERAAKLKQEEQALKQARIKAGVPDPTQYMW